MFPAAPCRFVRCLHGAFDLADASGRHPIGLAAIPQAACSVVCCTVSADT
jgi:hypothetical protein